VLIRGVIYQITHGLFLSTVLGSWFLYGSVSVPCSGKKGLGLL